MCSEHRAAQTARLMCASWLQGALAAMQVANQAAKTPAAEDEDPVEPAQPSTGPSKGPLLDTVLLDMQAELETLGMSFLYKVDDILREMPSRNLPDSFWSVLFADDMALVAASEGGHAKGSGNC